MREAVIEKFTAIGALVALLVLILAVVFMAIGTLPLIIGGLIAALAFAVVLR